MLSGKCCFSTDEWLLHDFWHWHVQVLSWIYQRFTVQSSLQQPLTQGNLHQTYLSIGDMPSMGTTQQTMLWQQNQYLVDSGINSGTTTQAPSISSKIESDDCSVKSQPLYNHDGYSMPSTYGHQVNGEVTLSNYKLVITSTLEVILL